MQKIYFYLLILALCAIFPPSVFSLNCNSTTPACFHPLPSKIRKQTKNWKTIDRTVIASDHTIYYSRYVNRYPNFYFNIIAYRVNLTWREDGIRYERWGTEKLQMAERDGSNIVKRFELRERRSWKKLWIGKSLHWQELHGREYDTEWNTILEIMTDVANHHQQ